MAIYKCKMCGGSLEVNSSSVVTCEYCNTTQTVPSDNNDKIVLFYNRANTLRQKNEFDKAIITYENIINEKPNDSEAYWGVVLCKYGIEYVDDPNTGLKTPTCHRTLFNSILQDQDYLNAIKYSDAISKELYEKEAKVIDDIQKGIIEISQKEEPYDIFICYKETDQGKRTKDSVIAQEIYDILSKKGYKVFFSRVTLESKLGREYEPIIFAALNSSKVMLVVGTRPEYFTSVWVKNEWSRYISIIEKSKDNKYIIPCFKDMEAYDLPDELVSFQSQDMSKLGFIQDLSRGLDKLFGREEATVKKSVNVVNQGINLNNLLNRCIILLESGDFDKVNVITDEILNHDSTNAKAYLYSLLSELKLKNMDELNRVLVHLDQYSNYKLAVQFGDDELKKDLLRIYDEIEANIIETEHLKAIELINNFSFDEAILLLENNIEYKNNKELISKANEYNTIYQDVIEKIKEKKYVKAYDSFKLIDLDKEDNEYYKQCSEQIYKEAKEQFKIQRYSFGLDYLSRIQNYKDSNELYKKYKVIGDKNNEELYQKLKEAIRLNDLDAIYSLCGEIGNYKDTLSVFNNYKNEIIEKLLKYNIFGKYPQKLTKGIFLNAALKKVDKVDKRGYLVYQNKEYYKEHNYKGISFYDSEPIKWNIVKKTLLENGEYLLELTPEYLLDECRFSKNRMLNYIEDTRPLNNYEISEVRSWLNRMSNIIEPERGFIQKAFNRFERSLLEINHIKFENTILNDYVFIYNKKELEEVFKTNNEKIKQATDYANRIVKSNFYMTREKSEKGDDYIVRVSPYGEYSYTSCVSEDKVLPVIRIKVKID